MRVMLHTNKIHSKIQQFGYFCPNLRIFCVYVSKGVCYSPFCHSYNSHNIYNKNSFGFFRIFCYPFLYINDNKKIRLNTFKKKCKKMLVTTPKISFCNFPTLCFLQFFIAFFLKKLLSEFPKWTKKNVQNRFLQKTFVSKNATKNAQCII